MRILQDFFSYNNIETKWYKQLLSILCFYISLCSFLLTSVFNLVLEEIRAYLITMKLNQDFKSDMFFYMDTKPDCRNTETCSESDFPDFKMAESNALILRCAAWNVTDENIERFQGHTQDIFTTWFVPYLNQNIPPTFFFFTYIYILSC